MDLGERAKHWEGMNTVEFKREFNGRIKNSGREPSFAWRLEKYIAEILLPLHTGAPIDFEVSLFPNYCFFSLSFECSVSLQDTCLGIAWHVFKKV